MYTSTRTIIRPAHNSGVSLQLTCSRLAAAVYLHNALFDRRKWARVYGTQCMKTTSARLRARCPGQIHQRHCSRAVARQSFLSSFTTPQLNGNIRVAMHEFASCVRCAYSACWISLLTNLPTSRVGSYDTLRLASESDMVSYQSEPNLKVVAGTHMLEGLDTSGNTRYGDLLRHGQLLRA